MIEKKFWTLGKVVLTLLLFAIYIIFVILALTQYLSNTNILKNFIAENGFWEKFVAILVFLIILIFPRFYWWIVTNKFNNWVYKRYKIGDLFIKETLFDRPKRPDPQSLKFANNPDQYKHKLNEYYRQLAEYNKSLEDINYKLSRIDHRKKKFDNSTQIVIALWLGGLAVFSTIFIDELIKSNNFVKNAPYENILYILDAKLINQKRQFSNSVEGLMIYQDPTLTKPIKIIKNKEKIEKEESITLTGLCVRGDPDNTQVQVIINKPDSDESETLGWVKPRHLQTMDGTQFAGCQSSPTSTD